jgi:NADH:ubiquinone oxidoreductase subunit K
MGELKAAVFVGAMLLGMGIFGLLERRAALSPQKA